MTSLITKELMYPMYNNSEVVGYSGNKSQAVQGAKQKIPILD